MRSEDHPFSMLPRRTAPLHGADVSCSHLPAHMDERKKSLDKMRVLVEKMPSLSTTVGKVLEICSRPDTAPNDLNKVISLDPVLTGPVLKLINSAYCSLGNKVTSLTRTIIMLGLHTVKNLALSTVIIRCVAQLKKTKSLPIKASWAHSIGGGLKAKLPVVEQNIPLAEREEFFVAGLLHDLGKVPFGDGYAAVLAQGLEKAVALNQIERQMMEIDHEEVGRLIAAKWKINAAQTDAISHHRDPRNAAPKTGDWRARLPSPIFMCAFLVSAMRATASPMNRNCSLCWRCVISSGVGWSA